MFGLAVLTSSTGCRRANAACRLPVHLIPQGRSAAARLFANPALGRARTLMMAPGHCLGSGQEGLAKAPHLSCEGKAPPYPQPLPSHHGSCTAKHP